MVVIMVMISFYFIVYIFELRDSYIDYMFVILSFILVIISTVKAKKIIEDDFK